MKRTIEYIRNTLTSIYSHGEINSFVNLIFEHFYNYSKHEMILYAGKKLSDADFDSISKIVDRLKHHEPIQYIFGRTEFYGLNFHVSPAVLIPRQETEELVDLIIRKYKNQKIVVLDIGTGSGCIPIAIKKCNSNALVFACDISSDALNIARQNAKANHVEVFFFQLNILSEEKLENRIYDIVISNPPYVTINEMQLMQKNVLDFEPHLALFVNNDDPLVFYRVIIEKTDRLLKSGGEIYFEINEAYGNSVVKLLAARNYEAKIIKDINGKDRIVVGKKPVNEAKNLY